MSAQERIDQIFERLHALRAQLDAARDSSIYSTTEGNGAGDAELEAQIETLEIELSEALRASWAERTTLPDLVFDSLGGVCPTQASGLYRDRTFYFRYRWGHWSFSLHDRGGPAPDFCSMSDEISFETDGAEGEWNGGVMSDERVIESVEMCCREFDALEPLRIAAEAGTLDRVTWYYVLWRWHYGDESVTMDCPYRLGQRARLDPQALWIRDGILAPSDGRIRARSVPKRIKHHGLGEPRADGTSAPLIDVLHRCCWYVRAGKPAAAWTYLTRCGLAENERLWATARALCILLPEESQERRWTRSLIASRSAEG